MKRSIKFLSVCLVVMLLALALTACNDEKKLVGTWEEADEDVVLVLADDGTGTVTESGMGGSLTWSVEDDQFSCSVSICGTVETLDFTYSVSGDELILTDEDGETETFVKK